MRIILKNKETLLYDDFKFKCSIGKKGSSNNKKVWDYSNDLETHTVETHIYRLRKKIKDTFDDEKFILYDNNGYFIN